MNVQFALIGFIPVVKERRDNSKEERALGIER